ncbi:MAG: hypothetical protein KF902_06115 [Phycisphaeraceae bacterium]|nr:hypothetical protein [Phycisphaeraceae bacterium]QYK48967.1 MAG: hypothetical protein KF838_03740 [Phycisphaeraceae bacterium]
MRAVRTKVTRMERAAREKADAAWQGDWLLMHRLSACQVAYTPGIERVRPEHTDPETYRDIQETLAWARGDYAEAERLHALDPNKQVPPPPGTPWEEQLRLAREALDRCADEAHDSTERVRRAIEMALASQPLNV